MTVISRLQIGKSVAGKKGKAPRAVYRSVGIWKRNDGTISMTCANPVTEHKEFHTTINNRPGSIRYHPNLFEKLKDILKTEGRW